MNATGQTEVTRHRSRYRGRIGIKLVCESYCYLRASRDATFAGLMLSALTKQTTRSLRSSRTGSTGRNIGVPVADAGHLPDDRPLSDGAAAAPLEETGRDKPKGPGSLVPTHRRIGFDAKRTGARTMGERPAASIPSGTNACVSGAIHQQPSISNGVDLYIVSRPDPIIELQGSFGVGDR